jgi:hypothetical protein
MTTPAVQISALIPTHGQAPLLGRTLETLAAAPHDGVLRRVWVLENGPRGAAEGICAAFRDRLPLEFRSYPEPGKNRAMQRVLPELGDDLLLFLDDDIRIHPELVRHYAAAAARHGRGHYFGGSVEPEYEREPPAWLRARLPKSAAGFVPREGDRQFIGMNFAAFAEDVRRAGGFDPRFGPGAVNAGTPANPMGSETSLQRQLCDVGVSPVPVPGAIVGHWVPADRCTAEWALHRVRRLGMSFAIAGAHPGPRLFGVPRWTVRQLLQSIPAVVLSRLTIDPGRRFDRQYDFQWSMGVIEGFRLAPTLAGGASVPAAAAVTPPAPERELPSDPLTRDQPA